MAPRKQKKDHYEQDYKPGQDCDQEHSDQEEPEYKPIDIKKHYRKLRNKDASEEAPESLQIAAETATNTSRRPKQPPKSKGKTKQTVGSKVNTPPNVVVWCRNTSICREARVISEKTKSPVICRCGIKVLEKRSKLAKTTFDSILPPKAVLVNTPTGRFVQLICHLVLSIAIWFAIAWAFHRLLRSHGYNTNLPVIFHAKRWLID